MQINTASAAQTFIFTCFVKSLLIFAVTAPILWVLRRSSAANRALAWQHCLLSILLLPALSVTVPSLRIRSTHQPALLAGTIRAPLPSTNIRQSQPISNRFAGIESVTEVPLTAPERRSQTKEVQEIATPKSIRSSRLSIGHALFLVWITVAMVLLLRLLVGAVLLRRVNRSSTSGPQPIEEACRRLAVDFKVSRWVRVATAIDPSISPMTWGLFRPVVLLPAEAAEWSHERLQAVLMHELGHIKRLDWPGLVLADIAAALYWFHPGVWILRRRLRAECEKACDDIVLTHGTEPAIYASILLEFARRIHARVPSLSLAIAIQSSGSALENRVKSVLRSNLCRQPVTGLSVSASLALVAFLVTPLAAARLVPSAIRLEPTVQAHSFPVGTASKPDASLVDNSETLNSRELDLHTINSPDGRISPAQPVPLRSAAPAAGRLAVSSKTASELADITDLHDFRWGSVKDGLQAGIHIHGRLETYAAGDRVPIDAYIRNTSGHDISFSFGGRCYLEQAPEVRRDEDPGTPQKVTGAFLTGLDAAYIITLAPGQAVQGYSAGLALGPKQRPSAGAADNGLSGVPYLDKPIPGTYTITQTVLYHLMTRSQADKIYKSSRSGKVQIIEPANIRTVLPNGTDRQAEVTLIPLEADSNPLTSGAERFTISDEHTKTPRGEGSVAWGKPESGLQAGLRSPGDRRDYHFGQTIEMEYIVRNVSDSPVTLQHDVTPGVAGVISDIVDSNGKKARTMGLPVLHTSEVRDETLQPGETVIIGKTMMGILRPRGSLGELDEGSRASNWLEATPGTYQIRHLDTLYLKKDFSKVVLYTGYLPLTIQTAQNNVSWGRPIDGLRAGLAISEVRPRRVARSDITGELYINNVSRHSITIKYVANRDTYFVPTVIDAHNTTLNSDWRNMEVMQLIEGRSTLKPGESVCIADPAFTIANYAHNELIAAVIDPPIGTWYVGRPGIYHVKMTAELNGLHVEGADSSIAEPQKDPKPTTPWRYYPTGDVTVNFTGG